MQYTATQERTLEFLDKMETRESLGDDRSYSCRCYTCNKIEILQSAGTVSALFMPEHAGHKTFIKLN